MEANAANVNNGNTSIFQKEIVQDSRHSINHVKDRIVQSFNLETSFSPYQIDHTNLHANYTISHTNVHADYIYDREHTNQHSNTPQKHVNDHSNSPL